MNCRKSCSYESKRAVGEVSIAATRDVRALVPPGSDVGKYVKAAYPQFRGPMDDPGHSHSDGSHPNLSALFLQRTCPAMCMFSFSVSRTILSYYY